MIDIFLLKLKNNFSNIPFITRAGKTPKKKIKNKTTAIKTNKRETIIY